jgi:hypothetical protein
MAHLRLIDGGAEHAAREARIDQVIRDDIEPRIALVQVAARFGDVRSMRRHGQLLVKSVNELLDEGPDAPAPAIVRSPGGEECRPGHWPVAVSDRPPIVSSGARPRAQGPRRPRR